MDELNPVAGSVSIVEPEVAEAPPLVEAAQPASAPKFNRRARRCPTCDFKFVPSQPNQVICSDCARKGLQPPQDDPKPKKCKQCKQKFVPGHNRTETCPECKAKPTVRNCATCGDEFNPHGSQKECDKCIDVSVDKLKAHDEQKAAKVCEPKVCIRCQEIFEPRTGPEKRCPSCSDLVKQQTQQRKQRRIRLAERESTAAKKPTGVEIDQKHAKKILEQRGFNGGVLDAMMNLAYETADILNVTPNQFYFQNGPTAITNPKQLEQGYPSGELLDHKTLFSVFEFCVMGREILGQVRTYEEWLQLRYKAKTDLWFLCVDVCGKGLVEKTHRPMIDLLVKKNPTLLKPQYNQEEFKEALREQDECHERLCLYPRSFYKSTISVLDIVQWFLVMPDIRCLVVTATVGLATTFVRETSQHFLLNIHRPTNLNLLFPEMTISETSETEFNCPQRILGLKEPSLWASAKDVESTGYHCDALILDDYVSELNSGNPDMRDKLFTRFTLISELLDRPWGFLTLYGTRYSGDKSSLDLYGRLIQQQDPGMKILVKGAWTVLPHAKHKKIHDLLEEDVDLLFPLTPSGKEGKGSFRILRKKLLDNERTFRQQQLNEGVSDEADVIATFTMEELQAKVRPPNYFKNWGAAVAMKVGSLDQAQSVALTADRSALALATIYMYEGKNICVIDDVIYGRYKTSQLSHVIVDAFVKHQTQRAVFERSGDFENLIEQVHRAGLLKGVPVPHIGTIAPQTTSVMGTSIPHKIARMKTLESYLNENRLFFTNAPYINELFPELLRTAVGKKSGSTKKDDLADAVGQLCQSFLRSSVPQEIRIDEEAEKMAYEARVQKGWYDLHFGVPQPPSQQPIVFRNGPEEIPANPLTSHLARYNMIRKTQ